jgi:3-oxoacyl-[acyl-carrier protein] reductase
MDLKIAGKKALVCASSRGLGRAIALALAAEGVELMLTARSAPTLKGVAEEAKQAGCPAVHLHACDLTEAAARQALIEATLRELKQVDILIHNGGGPSPTKAFQTTVEQWAAGYMQLFPNIAHLNQAFVPAMQERKWGRVLAVTSLSVLEPIEGLAISSAMRSAVTAMLKTLADEVAIDGVTVNCLAPGSIKTDRTESLFEHRLQNSGQTREEFSKTYLKPIPAGRQGDPAEFGAVAAFLCSQQAAYITGSTIAVDGGKRRSTY